MSGSAIASVKIPLRGIKWRQIYRRRANNHSTYQTNATLRDDIRYRVSQLNTDDSIGTGDSHHGEYINDRVAVVYLRIKHTVRKLFHTHKIHRNKTERSTYVHQEMTVHH